MSMALLPPLPVPEDRDSRWQGRGTMALLVTVLGTLAPKHRGSRCLCLPFPFPLQWQLDPAPLCRVLS